MLEALTADRTPVTVDLSKIAIDSEEETYMHEMACENERKLRDNSFKAQYSWVGGMSEALISAEQNGKWGYIDGEGRVVLPFQYKWASDFAEGRAVVVAPSGTYALIDKTGREILPAMYELMEWDAVHGVVKVSYEGVFGLADRQRNGDRTVAIRLDGRYRQFADPGPRRGGTLRLYPSRRQTSYRAAIRRCLRLRRAE